MKFETIFRIVMNGKNHNQSDVAEKIGISQGSLNNILKRRTRTVPVDLKIYVEKGIFDIVDGLGITLSMTETNKLEKKIQREFEAFTKQES